MTERYRAASFAVLPFAAAGSLAYVGDGFEPRLLRPDVAAALGTLRSFATLEEHGDRAAARLPDPALAAKARSVLAELARHGALVSESQVVETLLRGDDVSRPPLSIHTLAVPTCDRVESLTRALDQFASCAQRSGRRLRIVVSDDSKGVETRAATRQAVRQVAAKWAVHVAYLDRDGRAKHAERLSAEAGVPIEVVRFGLLGDPACGPPVGANRNSLLLACLDEPTLWCDDDVEPRTVGPALARPGVAFGCDGDPYVIRFFPDREAALAGVVPEEHDPFLLHERWLGKTLPEVARSGGQPLDVSDATTEMLRDIRDGRGRIVTTFTGIYGDSAMSMNTALLFGMARQAHAGVLEDEALYRAAMRSREMLRSAPRPTVVASSPFMATSFAFDPRSGFPPTLPVLCNEDALFGMMLARCFPGAYGLQLPVAFLHAPPGRRAYVDRNAAAAGVGFVDELISFLSLHAFDAQAGDWPDRLRVLGERLRLWAESPSRQFFSVAHQALLRLASGTAARAQALLDGPARTVPYWSRDLVSFLERLGVAVPGQQYVLPVDLPGRNDLAGPEPVVLLMQRLARTYGMLLAAWPTIIEAERRLRDAGAGIAGSP